MRLVRLTTPPLMRSSVKDPIQFSRCYVIHCPLYSSRDIFRFDKKFLCSFVCLHNFQTHFYAFCFVHCPLLKGERHAPLYSPVFKKFFQTSYECITERGIIDILLCSITTNGTKMIHKNSLTSYSFHDKIELVILQYDKLEVLK